MTEWILVGAGALFAGCSGGILLSHTTIRKTKTDYYTHGVESLSALVFIQDHFKRFKVYSWLNKLVDDLKRKKHAEEISVACARLIPDFLDMVCLGLSSGLSFDASLELYCKTSQNELSSLLKKTYFTWQIGLDSRAHALMELADEIHNSSLQFIAELVSQALEFGTPLAETLEHQADLIRTSEQSALEEKIEKVPVKMLLPMGTLLLPAMLLAIMGPLIAGSLQQMG